MPIQQQLNVEIDNNGHRNYPIYIGNQLLGSDLVSQHIKGNQALIVSNAAVAHHYLKSLTIGIKRQLPSIQLDYVEIPEGEQNKTLATFEIIINQLMQNKHNRTTTLIALGGGIVGDISGFAAAAYQRGVNFIQVPTTLLAQVDSSVGGKTGVNHPLGKNMVGAFHQPQAVIIDSDTLNTLPNKEFNAGVAEIIKYGLIKDSSFFDWLEQHIHTLPTNPNHLAHAIACSCETKANIVALDERETGVRALLNYGHTFGHAIESLTEYRQFLHGEAVAVGMLMAAEFSMHNGTLSNTDVERIKSILQQSNLPTGFPQSYSTEQFLNAMGADKKAVNGKLRFITLDAIGTAVVNDDYSVEALVKTLDHYCRFC